MPSWRRPCQPLSSSYPRLAWRRCAARLHCRPPPPATAPPWPAAAEAEAGAGAGAGAAGAARAGAVRAQAQAQSVRLAAQFGIHSKHTREVHTSMPAYQLAARPCAAAQQPPTTAPVNSLRALTAPPSLSSCCPRHLALKDLLLDAARGEQAVDEDILLLPLPPHPPHGLLVVRGVPAAAGAQA